MFNAKLFTRLIPVFAGITMLVASCDKNNVTAEPEVHHFTRSMSDLTLSSGVLTITKDDPDTPFYYAIVKKSSLEALGETSRLRPMPISKENMSSTSTTSA